MSWTTAALGEIAERVDYGVTASAISHNTGYKFLRITDIQDGSVEWSDVPYCNAADRKLQQSRLRDGDIVFARTGATTGKSILIKDPPPDAVFASYLIRVRASECVEPRYLAHFFQSGGYWAQVRAKTQGAAQGGVNSTSLRELNVPLPPSDEQRRIAAILDKADALRRKRKRALDLLDGLTQSIFLEMFGDPVRNPKRLPRGKIGDLLDDVRYGTSQKAGKRGDLPILRMGNITYDGRIVVDDLKYIDLPEKDIARFTVKRGDVVFNRTNSADLVGKCAVFDLAELYAFAGYLVRARTRQGIRPEYLAGYLNSAHGKAVLRNMAKSIVGMANINAKEMQSIAILIPDQESQDQYFHALERLRKERVRQEGSLTSLNGLFASLQSRAFSGQL